MEWQKNQLLWVNQFVIFGLPILELTFEYNRIKTIKGGVSFNVYSYIHIFGHGNNHFLTTRKIFIVREVMKRSGPPMIEYLYLILWMMSIARICVSLYHFNIQSKSQILLTRWSDEGNFNEWFRLIEFFKLPGLHVCWHWALFTTHNTHDMRANDTLNTQSPKNWKSN